MSRATWSPASSRKPRSTSTSWRRNWSWCRRSGCRTTCRPRSAKGRLRPRTKLFGRHQVAFAAGDGLVEDLAHRIDAGAALRRRALAAEHLLAAGGAGAGGGADLVVADAVANADDHKPARSVTMRTIRRKDTQEFDPTQARMRTVRRIVRAARFPVLP